MTTRTTATSSTTRTSSTRSKSAITDYTSGALDGYEKKDIEGLLTDRIEKAREDLDEALERIRALVEPVAPPKRHAAVPAVLLRRGAGQRRAAQGQRAQARRALQGRRAPSRAPSPTSPTRWTEAGYSDAEAEAIRKEIAHYVDVRAEVKLGAGEDVDFKQYEAGMRFLLDTYIQAGASEIVSNFEDTGLIDLIVKLGAGRIDKLPDGHQEGSRGRR